MGLALSRVFELCEEIKTFLRERKSPLSKHFDDNKFIGALAYLTDIFSSLNQLNMQMQGKSITIADARDKIQGFQKKLDLWSVGVARIFDWGGPNHKSHTMTSSEIFEKGTFCGAKISYNRRSEAVT